MADATKTVEFKGKTSQLKKELQGINKNIEELGIQLTSAQRVWQSVGSTMMLVGAALTVAIVVPLGAMGKAAVSSAKDFEYGMASVAAVSGAVGEDFAKLEEQAKQLGATTKFTAVEAAEGMQMLGRAGWEANEILEAMPGLLNLSAAGMLELGRAADIVSDVMMAFGESADQAVRYADIFAAAAANANTTVEGLGQAMAYAAPSAANMGISIEQTAASLAIFADAGIKATRAGTTMDAMLRELRNKVGKDGQVDFGQFAVSVYDSSGAMRDFYEIMEEIYANMDGLTQQQKDYASGLIFSTRALRGFNVMQTAGIDRMREMEGTLKDSAGASEEMADIMMDTLQGAMIELSSAFEGLKISFGEILIPMVTSFFRSITNVVRVFTELPKSVKVTMVVIAGLTSALILATTVFGLFIVLTTKALAMTPKLAFKLKAMSANMKLLAYSTNSATKAMAKQQLMMNAQMGSFKLIKRSIAEMITYLGVGLKKAYASVVTAIQTRLIPALYRLRDAINRITLSGIIDALKLQFLRLVQVIHNSVIPAFSKLFVFLAAHPIILAVTAIIAALVALSVYMHNELTKDLTDFSEVVSEETSNVVGSFIEMSDKVNQQLFIMKSNTGLVSEEMMEEVSSNFHLMANQVIEEMERAKNDGIEALTELYMVSKTLTPEEFELMKTGMLDVAEQKINSLKDAQREYAEVAAEVASQGGKATQQQIDKMQELAEVVRQAGIDALSDNLGEAQAIRHQMQRDERASDAQHASEMLKKANKQYTDRLNVIEDFYLQNMQLVDYFEKQGMGDFAEKLRSETETAYYQMKYEATSGQADLISDIRSFAGVYVGEIDWVTGEIKTGWSKIWEGVSQGPTAGFKKLWNMINPIRELRKEAKELAKELGLSGKELEQFVDGIAWVEEQLQEVADNFGLTAESVAELKNALDLDEKEFMEVLESIVEVLDLTEEEAEDFIETMNSLRIDANKNLMGGVKELQDQITESFQQTVKTAEEQLEEMEKFHEEARATFKETLKQQTKDLEQEHDQRLQKLRDHHDEARRLFDDRMDKEMRKLDERQMKELAQYDDRIAAILKEQKADDRQVELAERRKEIEEQRHRIYRAQQIGSVEEETREKRVLQELIAKFNKEDRDANRQNQIEKIREQKDAHAERLQAEKEQALEKLNVQKEALEEKLKAEEEGLKESLDQEKEAFLEEAAQQEQHLEDTLRRDKESFEERLQAQEEYQADAYESRKQHLKDMEALEEAEDTITGIEGAVNGVMRQTAADTTVPTSNLNRAAGTPVSTYSNVNEFNIDQVIVRDEYDIDKIAEKLHRLQENANLGVRV